MNWFDTIEVKDEAPGESVQEADFGVEAMLFDGRCRAADWPDARLLCTNQNAAGASVHVYERTERE